MARVYGYVVVTALFVLFWIWLFWPFIQGWWWSVGQPQA